MFVLDFPCAFIGMLESQASKQYKWKKLAAEVLRSNGGVLKLKKLQSKVLKSAQCADDGSKAALKADMLTKVRLATRRRHVSPRTTCWLRLFI